MQLPSLRLPQIVGTKKARAPSEPANVPSTNTAAAPAQTATPATLASQASTQVGLAVGSPASASVGSRPPVTSRHRSRSSTEPPTQLASAVGSGPAFSFEQPGSRPTDQPQQASQHHGSTPPTTVNSSDTPPRGPLKSPTPALQLPLAGSQFSRIGERLAQSWGYSGEAAPAPASLSRSPRGSIVGQQQQPLQQHPQMQQLQSSANGGLSPNVYAQHQPQSSPTSPRSPQMVPINLHHASASPASPRLVLPSPHDKPGAISRGHQDVSDFPSSDAFSISTASSSDNSSSNINMAMSLNASVNGSYATIGAARSPRLSLSGHHQHLRDAVASSPDSSNSHHSAQASHAPVSGGRHSAGPQDPALLATPPTTKPTTPASAAQGVPATATQSTAALPPDSSKHAVAVGRRSTQTRQHKQPGAQVASGSASLGGGPAVMASSTAAREPDQSPLPLSQTRRGSKTLMRREHSSYDSEAPAGHGPLSSQPSGSTLAVAVAPTASPMMQTGRRESQDVTRSDVAQLPREQPPGDASHNAFARRRLSLQREPIRRFQAPGNGQEAAMVAVVAAALARNHDQGTSPSMHHLSPQHNMQSQVHLQPQQPQQVQQPQQPRADQNIRDNPVIAQFARRHSVQREGTRRLVANDSIAADINSALTNKDLPDAPGSRHAQDGAARPGPQQPQKESDDGGSHARRRSEFKREPTRKQLPTAEGGQDATASPHLSRDLADALSRHEDAGFQARLDLLRSKVLSKHRTGGSSASAASGESAEPSRSSTVRRSKGRELTIERHDSNDPASAQGMLGARLTVTSRSRRPSVVQMRTYRGPLQSWKLVWACYALGLRLAIMYKEVSIKAQQAQRSALLDPNSMRYMLKILQPRHDEVLSKKIRDFLAVRSNLRTGQALPKEIMESTIKLLTLRLRSFTRYNDEQKRWICNAMKYEAYEESSLILREGHPANYFYFILNGQVEYFQIRENTKYRINIVSSGETFGEVHLLPATRGESVATTMPSEFLSIELPTYFQILSLEDLNHKALKRDHLQDIFSDSRFLNESIDFFHITHYEAGETILFEGVGTLSMFWIISGLSFVRKTHKMGHDAVKHHLSPYEQGMQIAADEEVVQHTLTIREYEPGDSFPSLVAYDNPMELMFENMFQRDKYVERVRTLKLAETLDMAFFTIVARTKVTIAKISQYDYVRFASQSDLAKLLRAGNTQVSIKELQDAFIEKLQWEKYKRNVVDEVRHK
ncbi:hypothetical protein BC831DRAFT_461756 [Entophlyctis helioformis]|nr:hypothetical protein BC831DRAFT_461756 [Entophlyctis helioformis]